MECSFALGIQNNKQNMPVCIEVVSFSGEKKTISKNQVVAMVEIPLKLMLATEQAIGETLGVMENRESLTKA